MGGVASFPAALVTRGGSGGGGGVTFLAFGLNATAFRTTFIKVAAELIT